MNPADSERQAVHAFFFGDGNRNKASIPLIMEEMCTTRARSKSTVRLDTPGVIYAVTNWFISINTVQNNADRIWINQSITTVRVIGAHAELIIICWAHKHQRIGWVLCVCERLCVVFRWRLMSNRLHECAKTTEMQFSYLFFLFQNSIAYIFLILHWQRHTHLMSWENWQLFQIIGRNALF